MYVIYGSENWLGEDGWGTMLKAAESCARLKAMEPMGAEWLELKGGSLRALELGAKQDVGLVVAVVTRFHERSASCLTRLDMGCALLVPRNDYAMHIYVCMYVCMYVYTPAPSSGSPPLANHTATPTTRSKQREASESRIIGRLSDRLLSHARQPSAWRRPRNDAASPAQQILPDDPRATHLAASPAQLDKALHTHVRYP